MRNVSFHLLRGKFNTFCCMTSLSLTMFFVKTLSAEQIGANKPSQAEVAQKIQKFQTPFITNMGQADERVEQGRVGTAYQKLSNRGGFCMKDWIEID